MQSVGPLRSHGDTNRAPDRVLRTISIVAFSASVVLLMVVLGGEMRWPQASPILLVLLVVTLLVVIFAHARFLVQFRKEHRLTAGALLTTEHEFQQMADNIHEIFWMLDAKTKETIYVNLAYETITGRSRQSLQAEPSSYEDAIHPDDRSHILGRLHEATQTGKFDEKFRIVWPTGESRWVSARGFPVRDHQGNIYRLVGTAEDITAQRGAEEQVAKSLNLAEGAWAESEALRKATLALTQDLRMDFVLDALLQSLTELISCECARIWLLEGDTRLFVAREKLPRESPKARPKYPFTLDAAGIPFLQSILRNQESVLFNDTQQEADWQLFRGDTHSRAWLSVPLVASQRTLGLLSVGHTKPDSFTNEDLRRAHLLAIPAAAAIQNSRLYECASIYGSELEKRINDLHEAKTALEYSEENRRTSEDKFQKVFHSNPVAFSITTVDEGRFLDVNAAFERRYGYSREEVIGRTVHELRIWEEPADREVMTAQLQKGGPIRNLIARHRTKSGDIRITTYSADKIRFDHQRCVIAVLEDLFDRDSISTN